jgi:hypothetical protein
VSPGAIGLTTCHVVQAGFEEINCSEGFEVLGSALSGAKLSVLESARIFPSRAAARSLILPIQRANVVTPDNQIPRSVHPRRR